MTGLLRVLRGTNRQAALIQRPRRKMHVATIAPGEQDWLTLCDRYVAAAGTRFWGDAHDASTTGEEHADAMCAYCYRFVLLAVLFAPQRAAAPVARRSA